MCGGVPVAAPKFSCPGCQQFHALEQHSVGVVQVDLLGLEIDFQRLHG
jgi:hypothetical protein